MFVSMVIDLQVQENFNWTCGDRKPSEESGALTSRKAKANGPGAARLRSLVSLQLLNLSRGTKWEHKRIAAAVSIPRTRVELRMSIECAVALQ